MGRALFVVAISALGAAAVLGVGLLSGHLGRLDNLGDGSHPSVGPGPVVPPPDSKLVLIRWRNSDLSPAASAGRICVTDQRHGRICASYVIGERPADTLTRRIESLGLHVQSSG